MSTNIFFSTSHFFTFSSINLYSRACAEYKVTGPAPPSYSDGNVLQQQPGGETASISAMDKSRVYDICRIFFID